jgi:hypothetical protein
VKNSLTGRTFDEPEQLLEAITKFLDEIQLSELEVVFSHWIERIRWVLEKHLSVRFLERWHHSLITALYYDIFTSGKDNAGIGGSKSLDLPGFFEPCDANQ